MDSYLILLLISSSVIVIVTRQRIMNVNLTALLSTYEEE